jgi:hypothetical protein
MEISRYGEPEKSSLYMSSLPRTNLRLVVPAIPAVYPPFLLF